MNKKSKYTLYILTFLFLGWGLSIGCNKLTRSFRFSNVMPAAFFDARWESERATCLEEPAEIQRVLEEPFYFLDTGGSAYVFASQDGKYVIKFFQAHRLRPPSWVHWKTMKKILPLSSEHVINKKESQKTLQFSSYKLSLDALHHQTGVVYLHLNPTRHHKNQITLYDNIGIKHELAADQTAFVLQKRARRFAPHFKKLLADGKKEDAKLLLQTFAGFLHERALKGIRDGDITPRNNLGMIGDSLVIFDVDQLRTKNLSATHLEHMMRDSIEMFLWLKNKDSSLITFLKEEIKRLCESSDT